MAATFAALKCITQTTTAVSHVKIPRDSLDGSPTHRTRLIPFKQLPRTFVAAEAVTSCAMNDDAVLWTNEADVAHAHRGPSTLGILGTGTSSVRGILCFSITPELSTSLRL